LQRDKLQEKYWYWCCSSNCTHTRASTRARARTHTHTHTLYISVCLCVLCHLSCWLIGNPHHPKENLYFTIIWLFPGNHFFVINVSWIYVLLYLETPTKMWLWRHLFDKSYFSCFGTRQGLIIYLLCLDCTQVFIHQEVFLCLSLWYTFYLCIYFASYNNLFLFSALTWRGWWIMMVSTNSRHLTCPKYGKCLEI